MMLDEFIQELRVSILSNSTKFNSIVEFAQLLLLSNSSCCPDVQGVQL